MFAIIFEPGAQGQHVFNAERIWESSGQLSKFGEIPVLWETKHTLGPLFTLLPDVCRSWQPVWGPKGPGSPYPHTESRHTEKISKMWQLWVFHAYLSSATKPCVENSGLSGISRPSFRSARRGCNCLPTKFKWSDTFAVVGPRNVVTFPLSTLKYSQS